MRVLSVYQQLRAAVERADEICDQLRVTKTEYEPQLVRSLVNEFKWTTIRILSLCSDAIDANDNIDRQLTVQKIEKKYLKIRDAIGI